jgi:hypothetical protein
MTLASALTELRRALVMRHQISDLGISAFDQQGGACVVERPRSPFGSSEAAFDHVGERLRITRLQEGAECREVIATLNSGNGLVAVEPSHRVRCHC